MNIINKITLKILLKNKSRTFITIIGILLSLAMITAVTTSLTSLREFLIKTNIAREGDWHGAALKITKNELLELKEESSIAHYVSMQNIGYSKLEETKNTEKPYLFVGGISENFTDYMPLVLTKGTMPQNSNEIILPKHLAQNGGVIYQLNDTINLTLGSRIDPENNSVLTQSDPLQSDPYTEEIFEIFQPETEKTYTVVGFYERPSYEKYSAAGYTALTVEDESLANTYTAYIGFQKPKSTTPYMSAHFDNWDDNSDLLRLYTASNEGSYNSVIYGLGAVLICIIVVGSISLIHNAFSISLNERVKQIGLLSSIGATRRQILNSVLFEAFTLCLIGIPLGILAGIVGISITFTLLQDVFSYALYYEFGVSLQTVISLPAILTAVAIGFITVILSALLPALRVSKISVIDAIKQTKEITISPKQVKTMPFIYRIFGFEGMMANKNFKRNKRKYRSTIISLFISIVLFISASSFCAYLTESMNGIMGQPLFDLNYSYQPESDNDPTVEELAKILYQATGLTNYAYNSYAIETIKLDKNNLTSEYLDSFSDDSYPDSDKDSQYVDVWINFVEDRAYENFLDEQNFDKNIYLNTENPAALVIDDITYYDGNENKYFSYQLFKETNISVDIFNVHNDMGDLVESKIPQLKLGETLDTKPFFAGESSNIATLLLPLSCMDKMIDNKEGQKAYYFYFTSDNHRRSYDSLTQLLEEQNLSPMWLFNQAEMEEYDRALLAVVNIFSYGFIILISLIAIANVFHTVSTNISLRKKELAMISSIGMTKKSLQKMLYFECLIYGSKSLFYGLIASVFVTYFIYRSILHGWHTNFFIPIHAIIIVIFSIFIVVFSTMLYSMKKIQKENLIDALKNENL